MTGLHIPSRTIIHEVGEASLWPPECHSITQFTRQLHAELVNVNPGSLSPNAQEMFKEALRSLMFSVQTVEPENDGQLIRPITDVLDVVLSSVRMLRELKSLDATDGFGPRATKPVWASMINALCLAWSEDVRILSEVPFLLPRTSTSNDPKLLQFEGHASLLLSIFVPPKHHVDDDTVSIDNDGGASEDDSSSCISEDTFISLDIPFDGHILPGHGRRVSCVLPIVCVAEEPEICSLVTSAVYQRHIWGISTPTIGISLSKTGTTAKVFVGWIGDDDHDLQELPLVHLAFSKNTDNHLPAMGIFDLLNPAMSLYFAQFILRIQSHFTSILKSTISPQTRTDVCWRLDHQCVNNRPVNPHLISASDDWRIRIEIWISDVSSSGCADDSPYASISTYGEEQDARNGLEGAADLPALSIPDTKPSASDSTNPSRNSSSRTSEYGVEQSKPGCQLWFWERSSLRIGNIPLQDPQSDADNQINDMIVLYDGISAFAWPEGWSSLEEVPIVDRVYNSLRESLYEQYTTHSDSASSPPNNVNRLGKSTTDLLSSRFSIFFQAVEAARNLSKSGSEFEGTHIYEKETRFLWDTLLYSVCCSTGVAAADAILLDRPVHLPNNKAAKAGPAERFPAAAQAEHQNRLAVRQLVGALDLPPDAYAIAFSAFQNADSVRNHVRWLQFNPSTEGLLQPLQDARDLEPTTVIADAVLCTSLVSTTNISATFSPARDLQAASDLIKASSVLCKFELGPNLKIPRDPDENVLVPILFAEYQRPGHEIQQTRNRCQMCCISAVEYLATLGVTDFPIFGLITAGSRAYIMLAWKSSKSTRKQQADATNSTSTIVGYNYVFDHNLVSFDISVPLQAYHFAITVHRIYQRQGMLNESLAKRSEFAIA